MPPDTMRILGISGSLRRSSFNTALLHAAGGLVPPAARFELLLGLTLLPPYNEDDDIAPATPAVASWRAAIAAADALLIATPEYNGSVPGQLKNAIDWASRPFPGNALRGKPATVIGASTGIFGALWAQAELRKVLTTAGARVLDRELAIPDAQTVFDDRLRLIDDAVERDLRDSVEELVAAVLAVPC